MLKIFTFPKTFFAFYFLIFFLPEKSSAQLTYIPDPAFAAKLQLYFPSAMLYPDSLNQNDTAVISNGSLFLGNSGITDLTGIAAFVMLDELDCGGNNLTVLPPLPATLRTLDCSQNIGLIPSNLPSGLNTLVCQNNNLSSLGILPNSLTYLNCSNNSLTILPALPASLTQLYCENNLLINLPALPGSLDLLYCGFNPNLSCPAIFPSSLTDLDISGTPSSNITAFPVYLGQLGICSMIPPLLTLPPLPQFLSSLSIVNNLITELTTLPPHLEILGAQNNNISFIQPPFPPTLIELYLQNNPITCIPVLPAGLDQFNTDVDDCVFNKPGNCCQTYSFCSPAYDCKNLSYVTGTLFGDLSNDGLFNGIETGKSKINVFSSNGNYVCPTDSNGVYFLTADTGINFFADVEPFPYRVITTPQANHFFSNYGFIDSLNDIGLYEIPGVNDLIVSISSGVFTPGLNHFSFITFENTGTTFQSGQLYFVKPAVTNFAYANPAQSSVSGDTIFWNFSNISPLTLNEIYSVQLFTPTNVPIGLPVSEYAGIISTLSDTTPGNNFDFENDTTVGPIDPNVKIALPEIEFTTTQLSNGDVMEYCIHFQNTGTAPAINVVIADSLSAHFDLTTFRIIGASHKYTWKIENRVLYVRFENIMLPDSNTNEILSHGLVMYTVRPFSNLQPGTIMSNTAYIYFDFNAPIQTNITHTQIVFPSGISEKSTSGNTFQIFPNPSSSSITLSIENEKMDGLTINVFNVLGVRQKVTGSYSNDDFRLSINELATGVYFIQAQTKDGMKAWEEKFVKR